jgi:uncharacterized membrane protein
MPREGGGIGFEMFQNPVNVIIFIVVVLLFIIFIYYIYVWWFNQKKKVEKSTKIKDVVKPEPKAYSP